jgi:hypothetical protein
MAISSCPLSGTKEVTMGPIGDVEAQSTNRRRSKTPLVLHGRADVPSTIPQWERDLVAAHVLAAARSATSLSYDRDVAIGGVP